jgi:hypothetical protein
MQIVVPDIELSKHAWSYFNAVSLKEKLRKEDGATENKLLCQEVLHTLHQEENIQVWATK